MNGVLCKLNSLNYEGNMAGKTGGTLNRSPVHLLHRAAQGADLLFAVEVGDIDLTPRQLLVLSVVAENESVSQTDIVDNLLPSALHPLEGKQRGYRLNALVHSLRNSPTAPPLRALPRWFGC